MWVTSLRPLQRCIVGITSSDYCFTLLAYCHSLQFLLRWISRLVTCLCLLLQGGNCERNVNDCSGARKCLQCKLLTYVVVVVSYTIHETFCCVLTEHHVASGSRGFFVRTDTKDLTLNDLLCVEWNIKLVYSLIGDSWAEFHFWGLRQ